MGEAAAAERVTSWAALDADGWVLAGYLESERVDGRLGPLHAWRLDGTGRWCHRVLDLQGAGSATAVKAVGGRYFLVRLLHGPSRASERVLAPDLEPLRELDGAAVAVVGERHVVVQAGQPHFQAIHETELALVDLETGGTVPVFPPTPETPYRRELRERTAADYRGAGEGWCARNNHPCDPAKLDSSLTAIRYSPAADTLAFVIAYDEAPLEPVGPSRRVMYVVRGLLAGRLETREVVLPAGAGDDEAALTTALAPARQIELFGGDPAP